jgi:invasion protein IalB
MDIKIGDKETRKLSFSICQPDHCEAVLPLEEMAMKSLSAAPTAEITLHAVNGAEANGEHEGFFSGGGRPRQAG